MTDHEAIKMYFEALNGALGADASEIDGIRDDLEDSLGVLSVSTSWEGMSLVAEVTEYPIDIEGNPDFGRDPVRVSRYVLAGTFSAPQRPEQSLN